MIPEYSVQIPGNHFKNDSVLVQSSGTELIWSKYKDYLPIYTAGSLNPGTGT